MSKKKIAIVTGGTRGLGRKITERLIESDYFVHFTYINSTELAEELYNKYPQSCKGTKVNGAQPEEVDKYIDDILSSGTVDTLINNAGVSSEGLITNLSWNDIQYDLNVNFGGVFNFSHAIMKSMIKNKYGNIINISSLAATNIRAGNSTYGISKSAIDRFSLALAQELARFNVAVNIISPSFFESDMTRSYLTEDMLSEIKKNIPTKKLVRIEDVVDAVMCLCERKIRLYGVVLPISNGAHI
jgi:NAD(P)-dependent dehydrogenase (short-subunit alcohol dehydrogenase family)